MGCFLSLNVFDRETNLPVDLDLNFGASTLCWSEVVQRAVAKGIKLNWHNSEHNQAASDGVRCWWTDSFDEFYSFYNHVAAEKYLQFPDDQNLKGAINIWREQKGRYRFIFELV
ncbi:MAG: hypothetical protein ACREDF_09530 [Thermoplasmata archaeon]